MMRWLAVLGVAVFFGLAMTAWEYHLYGEHRDSRIFAIVVPFGVSIGVMCILILWASGAKIR